MAVVKANAYGHGVGPVAQAIRDRVEILAVANVAEARELHQHVPELPIYILGPALPHERAEIVGSGFVPAVSSYEEAAAYSALASSGRFPIHLTLDTGMGRIGVWQEEALRVFTAITELPNVQITGIASHLPSADEDEHFTHHQLATFANLTTALRPPGSELITHVHNSAGIIGFPAAAGDMVRAGLMLYGSAPLADFQPQLRAVMTWKTRVTLVRDVGPGRGISYGRTFIADRPMRVATLAVGYADGYQRHLSNRGAEVLVRGRRCPVLGRVTMDQIMVDVTALPGVAAGEEVVLMGRQGNEEILAAELAQKSGTIAWEIFTSVGRRVERVPV
jgi:alanine racemase